MRSLSAFLFVLQSLCCLGHVHRLLETPNSRYHAQAITRGADEGRKTPHGHHSRKARRTQRRLLRQPNVHQCHLSLLERRLRTLSFVPTVSSLSPSLLQRMLCAVRCLRADKLQQLRIRDLQQVRTRCVRLPESVATKCSTTASCKIGKVYFRETRRHRMCVQVRWPALPHQVLRRLLRKRRRLRDRDCCVR